jgi:hypothetical protein
MGFALLASAPAPQFPPAQLLTDADGNTFRFYLLGSPALSAASASSTSALSASAPVPASADDAGIADVLVALHQLQTSVDELKACVGVRLANGAEVMYEEVEGESLWSWSPVESRAASPSSAPAP